MNEARKTYAALEHRDAAWMDRLLGAIHSSDSFASILEEARRATHEARVLLASAPTSYFDIMTANHQAMRVLELAEQRLDYALNRTDTDPDEEPI